MGQRLSTESQLFRIIHEASLELAKVPTLDDLYRGIVELGIRDLGLDRVGLILFDKNTNMMQGTWGTDTDGHLCDGDDPVGWIAADNLMTHNRLTEKVKNVFAYYGKTASHLIFRKRFELGLQERVDLKTRELAEKVTILEKTMDRLVETEKQASLGRLVGRVAHEINTPLGNSILGLSYAVDLTRQLRDLLPPDEDGTDPLARRVSDLTKGLARVAANLDRTAQLVSRFKQLAVDQNETDAEVTAPLKNIVEGTIAFHRDMITATRLTVRTDIPPDLSVTTYPGLLIQILWQFLSNTVSYGYPGVEGSGPSGQPTSRPVEISAGSGHGTWNLVYTDHGLGIPPDLAPRLFEPFFTTARHQGAAGLGLSIVHTLVTQKMGGTLEPFTPPGGGLGFRLVFPH